MGLAVGDYNTDGRLDLLKTHFADDIPALYRNLGSGLFEDVGDAPRLGVQNRYVEWGAGLPDLDNDGWPDLSTSPATSIRRSSARCPQYPHRGPRIVFPQPGGARFEDVTMRAVRRHDAALEPRRRVRRHRQRRRRRRARDEHERAAVAAAQRLRGRNHWLTPSARRHALESRRDRRDR